VAANIEALAEMAEKGGYTKWSDKFRQDAALFREAGGPDRFAQEPQTQQVETQYKTSETPIVVEKTTDTLTQELEISVANYQDMGFHKHRALNVCKGKLKDMIMDLIKPQPESFKGRFDIPVIVFGHIPVEDQAKLAGVHYGLEGLYVRDWEGDPRGYRTPAEVYMTWMQDGRQNLKRNVKKVRSTFDPAERGATVYDGIGLYIARPNILTDHYVDLPGTSVGIGIAASLELWNGRPQLGYYLAFLSANPGFGSASCGRNKP
jgi:hypothetical protein